MKTLFQPFPQSFLWGATLSAHQVEGANYASDWWRFEQRPGRIAGNATSQRAAGHYERFAADFKLARDFGLNSLLFSIEWSRIEPEEGQFDETAIDHYTQVFTTLRELSIEPLCALQHVTLPRWFPGWYQPGAPGLFTRYARLAAERWGPLCRRWIPIHEPVHWITMACIDRLWPSEGRGPVNARRALLNMARAHAAAYGAFHGARADVEVGASIRARVCLPADDRSAWDLRAARAEQYRANQLWPRLLVTGRAPASWRRLSDVSGTIDFLGVAYYGRERVQFNPLAPTRRFRRIIDSEPQTHPAGLLEVLTDTKGLGLPMYITGNGTPAQNDLTRARFLLDHIDILRKTLDIGVDVLGYYHKSLLDGFEWLDGYSKRFGLMHVDWSSLTRTPNPSAFLYKELCQTGTIHKGAVIRFAPNWSPIPGETAL